MGRANMEGVSSSFLHLQRVQRSFDELSTLGPLQQRTLFRLARALGQTVIPLCARTLLRPGVSAEQARWACALLACVAEQHHPRVLAALAELVQALAPGELARAHVAVLMTELSSEPGARAERSAAAQDRAVRDLAGRLGGAVDIAHAADMLATQMDATEMLALADALAAREPQRAIRLLDELILRSDVEEPARRELRRIRAPLHDRGAARAEVPGRQPVATVATGLHASGRRVVIAARRRAGKQAGQRALCLLLAADGSFIDGLYRDDFATGGVEAEVMEPLRGLGYRFETASRLQAAQWIVRAARATRQLGRPLPRGFYLGRDLLGIHDEHVAGAADDDLGVLLERAHELLGAGQADRARPLFERYVAQAPDSAEGSAGLALCLIALGDDAGARFHLRRAAWLEPRSPNHHWNLSAIAHRQGRPGGCYLALVDYLELVGDFDEAPGDVAARRALAEHFVTEYERIARVEYPGAEPASVAQADELLVRARQLMEARQHEDAITVLEQALACVPDHYPSLAHLAVALMEQSRIIEARQHLDRALALRPGDPLALEAMQRLARMTSLPPRRARARRRSQRPRVEAVPGQ